MDYLETAPHLDWAIKANRQTRRLPPDKREWVCEYCGAELGPGKRGAKVMCIMCAIRRACESASQLAAKQGAFYEEWKRGMKRAARKL